MTRSTTAKPKSRLSTTVLAVFSVAVVVAVGTFSTPADAQRWDGYRYNRHHNWNGGYHRAPPIVYGSTYGSSYYGYQGMPYYYPPPLIYGPTISLPGVAIQIR